MSPRRRTLMCSAVGSRPRAAHRHGGRVSRLRPWGLVAGAPGTLAGLAIVNLLWAFLSTSRGGLLTATACFAFILLQVRSTGRRVVILAGVVLIGLLLASYFTPLQQTAVQRLSLLFDRSAALQTRTSVAPTW